MADPKKDPKSETAPVMADPNGARDAELAELRKAKSDSDKAARDAEAYAAELEKELKKRQSGPGDVGRVLSMLAEGQAQLADAVKQLVKSNSGEMLRHKDIVDADGNVPLAPEHRGTKKYRTTRPGFHQGRYVLPGEELIITDQKPSKTWVEVTAKPGSAKPTAPSAPVTTGRDADAEV